VRLYSVLFAIIAVIVVVLMIANAPSLLRNSSFDLPFLGSFVMPLRLIGLLSVVVVAGLFSLAWSLSATRTQARSAGYLRQIEDLRKSLDKEEASRFASLQANLDNHVKTILTRLEAGSLTRGSGASTSNSAGSPSGHADMDRLVSSLSARVDRVRDELAADIGAAEESILRALADAQAIARDRPRGS
jgi:uncharacterized integral membrane protein